MSSIRDMLVEKLVILNEQASGWTITKKNSDRYRFYVLSMSDADLVQAFQNSMFEAGAQSAPSNS